MFCRYCSSELAPAAVVCIKCGVPAGQGTAYCPFCAAPTDPNAAVCMTCGRATAAVDSSGQKSRMTAGLLGIFLGSFGVHNFYLGYTKKAVLQLCLNLGTWVLNLILLPILSFFTLGFGAVLYSVSWLPWLAVWIWGLVEGVLLLTGKPNADAKGVPLSD